MNPGTEETYISISSRETSIGPEDSLVQKRRPKETSQSFLVLSPHFNCNKSTPLPYGREEQEYGKRKRILPILYSLRPWKDRYLEESCVLDKRELAIYREEESTAQTRFSLVNKHIITYLTYAHSYMLNSHFPSSINITQNCLTVEIFIFQIISKK